MKDGRLERDVAILLGNVTVCLFRIYSRSPTRTVDGVRLTMRGLISLKIASTRTVHIE